MSFFCKCPRCGDRTFERLNSYSHCAQCLYFEDQWRCPEADVNEAQAALDQANKSCPLVVAPVELKSVKQNVYPIKRKKMGA